MALKLAALEAACEIDMVMTVRPDGVCKQRCLHCGAAQLGQKGRQTPLTREELRENLTREVPSVREGVRGKIVAAYLSRFPTTGVDTEPTDSDAAIEAAELAYELTQDRPEGPARMVLPMHGLRANRAMTFDPECVRRLERMVDLVLEGKVAGIIITVDFARSMGRISYDCNMASYLRTLEVVRRALVEDCPGFVAISIQGLQDVAVDNPYSAERANVFFQEVLRRSGYSDEEWGRLEFDIGREWVSAPRTTESEKLAPWIKVEGECEVIPFRSFVEKQILEERKLLRGIINANGSVSYSYARPGVTYNDTIDLENWEQFSDLPPIRNFSKRPGFGKYPIYWTGVKYAEGMDLSNLRE